VKTITVLARINEERESGREGEWVRGESGRMGEWENYQLPIKLFGI
jgi:hypothetical protein